MNYIRCHDDIGWVFADDDARRIGLGHRRLAIIDLVTGQQPMWTDDRGVAIRNNFV